MKKTKFILVAMLFLLTITLCSCSEEKASVKVKFNDSVEEELIYPGSYDLTELQDSLVSLKPTKKGYAFVGWYIDKGCTVPFDPATYNGTEALLNVYAKWDELRKIVTYSGTNMLDSYYYDDLVKGTVKIPDATKNNYKFLGWTTDSEGTTSFDIKTYEYPSDKKTVNVFAKFQIITTISFMNGNSLVAKEDLEALKSGESTVPTVSKDGFNFGGWFLDEAYTNEFDANNYVAVSSAVKVYAKWNAKPEVLYYDGETLIKKFFLEDAGSNTVTEPTKVGYDFVGWVDANGQAFAINAAATENQTAYAKWEQKVTVNFYNGETLVAAKYLDELNASTLPVATKDTYTFVNWCTDTQLSNVFDYANYTTQAKTVNVYAKFVRNTTIQFMNGNELVAERLLSGLKNDTLTNPVVSKAGFIFKAWTTDENGQYVFNAKTTETDELTIKVYAQWTEKLKVTYYVDNNQYDSKVLEDITNAYAPANPSKAGYDFVGWVDANGNAFVLNVSATANQAAYAKFEQKVTVNFYNGTTLVVSKYLDELTDSTLPTTAKDTYTFKGWFLDEQFTSAFVVEGYPTNVKTVNVYAKFEKITTVIFMNDTEEVGRVLLSALKDGSSTAPKATKPGFIFNQWLNGTTPFVASTFVTDEATITVYADWTEKAKVNYYVDSNVYDSKVLDDITNAYAPANPSKAGYDFVGWVDANGQAFVLDVTSASNLTAIAKFEQKVTVNFYNGTTLVIAKYLDELTDATLPTTAKDTYTFKGWFLDEQFTSAFVVEGYPTNVKTVNVYAKFEKITTVIFMNDTEEVGRVLLSALKDGSSTAPSASKYGYTFDKWMYNTQEFIANNVTTDEATITVSATFVERAKVNFFVDGSIYESKYLFDLADNYAPAAPTKSGFFFGYWMDSENQEFDLTTLDKNATENVILNAKWFSNPVIEGLVSNTNGTTITVSWNSVADYAYSVKVDNGEYAANASNSFVVPSDLAVGKHTITVKATFRGHEVTASIEVTQLVNFNLTGVSFDQNTRVVSWNALENATKYDYKFNNAANWTTVYTNSFAVDESLKAGSYSLTVTAYVTVNDTVIGSFEPKSTTVNVISIERLASNGLFINENDEYVLMVGVPYSFGTFTFPEASWYTLTESATKITPKAGEAGNVYELETTTGEKINVCVEDLVYTINSGVNYSYYLYSKSNGFTETNKTGFMDVTRYYEVGTDDNDFIIDIDVDGSGNYVTDYKFDIKGKVGNDTDVTKYLSIEPNLTKHVYNINWTSDGMALAEGTIVELILVEHYSTKTQRETTVPSYTFKFMVNNGVNAYDFVDLKAKVENTNITTVNMHQRVVVTDSMIPATYGTVDPSLENDDYYNTEGNSLITRYDNGQHDFKLNGNYFEIDCSQVRFAVSQEQAAGPGYKVYWQRAGVILLNGGSATVEDVNSYKVADNKQATFTNLRVKGNATMGMSQSIVNEGEDAIKAELLRQSGAIDGLLITSYNANYDNVVIHHCTEGTKIVSTNGYDGDADKVIYRKNNKHLYNLCSIGDNWANDAYIWADGLVEYKDSYLYETSGIAVVVGDNYSVTLGEEVAEQYVDEANNVFLCNYNELLLNNTLIDNWKVGSEEYFTAYGMAGQIASYKVAMEGNVSAATSGAYTLIKTDSNNFTYVNMAIQVFGEGALKSMNIGTTKTDGSISWAQVRNQTVASNNYPDHPMVNVSGGQYQLMYPICDYSTSQAFGQLYMAIQNELTSLGMYYQGYATYDDIKDSVPLLDSLYTAYAVENKLIPMTDTSALGQAMLFTLGFNNAYSNSDTNNLYVQVTVPNLNGNLSNYCTTIIVSGYKK